MELFLRLAHSVGVFTFEEYTCEHALNLYEFQIKTRIENFRRITQSISSLDSNLDLAKNSPNFPFSNFFDIKFTRNYSEDMEKCEELLRNLENMISEIEELRPFEILEIIMRDEIKLLKFSENFL